ncbi:DNA-3-methyladenine glycosylase [Anaeromicropila populeti]|uniref:Putative 3-methyladenine DNA glycosylase n=1 Tax=Anaeromicropila populeti TaxID=37658 RepID=A0A1I6J228_9FIRM|nr:DNA-3-methyladenine glycosylase [Anaeromicropila populeti]SFR72989.1 DNA-3-methyladenine glycosylase [Anaeromicropila populeti]
MKRLDKDFYRQDALILAKALLGKVLVHETAEGTVKGIIVETEAYMGAMDAGSHAYQNRKTPRTKTMYEAGGISYVYLIYGMYCCMNVVAFEEGEAQAVLLRALEPIEGIDLMKKRRNLEKAKNLCNGPGKLCMAMDITKSENAVDLVTSSLYIEDAISIQKKNIIADRRVNIDYAGEARDYPWRFFIKDNPYISVKKQT